MNQTLIRYICIAIILVTILLVAIFLMIRFIIKIKVNKRIKNYIIKDKVEDSLSIVDIIIKYFLIITKKLSNFFNKHHMFKKYRLRFEKYLIYLPKDIFNTVDLISAKFVFMLITNILYLAVIGIRGIYFNIINLLVLNILSFFIVDIIIILMYTNKKKLIEEQLLQAIIIMNSAFKSGKNIYEAVQIIKDELPSPMKDEFSIIAKDLDYGLDVSVIFERFYNRVKVEEAKYITSSLSLLNKTGGSIVTVFNMIEKRFYARLKIKDELKSLTASSRILSNTLCVLPFIYVLIISLLNPSFFKPLFTSIIGLILDIAILLLYICYIIVIKKVMKVDEVWK